jgi:hypothetical protein
VYYKSKMSLLYWHIHWMFHIFSELCWALAMYKKKVVLKETRSL